ncbi:response regulator transcription factor [Aureivirga sp. CE67]|uniref:response regulator transcription factor n=1 Tax=Aureivirga sp. CE67 TaxID=1788983 RepID=UPI001E302CEB|nr:helix-turn-helix transcriptional regulator [Aureivirga sp. CE67]
MTEEITFTNLQVHLEQLIESLENQNLIRFETIKSEELVAQMNKSDFYLTLHDVEYFRPICLNNKMVEFYGFSNNWLTHFDHFYYLKTIHTSTYSALIESISFFRKDNSKYLNLKYKLLHKNVEWKNMIGTTRTILRKKNGKPKYALSLLAMPENVVFETDIFEKIKKLTKREKQVIELLCSGFSQKDISEKLFISEHTVNTHVKNIYKKLSIKKISELFNIVEKYTI